MNSLTYLIKIVLNICSFGFALYLLVFIGLIVSSVFHYLFYKEPIHLKDTAIYHLAFLKHAFVTGKNSLRIIAIIVIIGFLNQAIILVPGVKQTIGSIFESGEFTTYYYVNMFPENSNEKNYRVIAQIHAYTKQYDENEYLRKYDIEKAFFTNGHVLTFYENEEPLKIGERVLATDEDGEIWEIELTNQKAMSPDEDN